MGHKGVESKTAARCRQHHLGQNQNPPTIDGVGYGASTQSTNQRRSKLDQTYEADDECRVGQDIGLIGDTHDGQLTADTGYQKSDPQSPERLVSPQWGDIRQEGLHTEV
jgi:hypothetical protein